MNAPLRNGRATPWHSAARQFDLTRKLYDRWAAAYPPAPHNPLMRAEQDAMLALLPDVQGSRVLDLACGSGRYAQLLLAARAAEIVALDFSLAMLQRVAGVGRVRGSMMHLPFADGVFDAIVSGLAVGHATDLELWMREAARVLKRGGLLLYSDFHFDAAQKGLKRTFEDERGRRHTVPHRAYSVGAHQAAAAQARLAIQTVRELRLGVELNEQFPGSDALYHRWCGVPLVLVVSARKS